MKKLNAINQVSGALKRFVLCLAVGAAVAFGVSQSASAAANDNFANAINLPGLTGTQTGSDNVGATFEAGEPECAYPDTTHTVWFKWTCPENGAFTITTLGSKDLGDGSEWDAIIGCFTGTAVESLTVVVPPTDTGYAETLSNIPVTNGTTYYFQLGGDSGNTQATNILLNWSFVSAIQAEIATFGTNVAWSAAVITTTSPTNGTVVWTVPFGSTLATLAPTFTLSPGATCNQGNGVVPTPNFNTSPVHYIVTASDSVKTRDYAVTVQFADIAGMLNVNFTGTARDGLEGPSGGGGGTWNQFDDGLNSLAGGTSTALENNAGSATPNGFSLSGYNGLDNWGNPSLQLIRDGKRIFSTAAGQLGTLVINNLPTDRKYNVYIASANASGGETSAGAFWTTNATTTSGPQPCVNTGAVNGSTWQQGNNYVLFANVVPDASGNITITGTNSGGFRSPINGFQVLDVGSSLNDKNILTFGPGAVITGTNIAWTVPYGTALTALAPTYTVTPGATGTPASGSTQNFSGSVHYIVTGADTTTKDYLVTVSITPASANKDILTFAIPGGNATITGTNINVVMALGTDVTALVPTYTVSAFANGSPASGVAHNFTIPQVYTVTAQDSSTKGYLVTVQLVASSGKVNVNFANTARSGLSGPRGDSGEVYNQLAWNLSSSSLTSLAGGTASALWDSAGVPTTVGVTYSTASPGLDNWGNPALQLIRDGLRNFPTAAGGLETLVVNNLPAGRKYDVYIASANASGGESSDGVFSTTNTTTTVGDQPCVNTGAVNGTTWAQGNNYVLFANVVPDETGKITVVGSNTGGFRLPVNGVQVVDVGAVPPTPTIEGFTGPVAGQFTFTGTASGPGSIVTECATSLDAPITWVPIQTNAVSAGAFSIGIPQGANPQAFYRLKGQ